MGKEVVGYGPAYTRSRSGRKILGSDRAYQTYDSQEEQKHYNEVIVKLDEYQGRLEDSQENKQKLEMMEKEDYKPVSDAYEEYVIPDIPKKNNWSSITRIRIKAEKRTRE